MTSEQLLPLSVGVWSRRNGFPSLSRRYTLAAWHGFGL